MINFKNLSTKEEDLIEYLLKVIKNNLSYNEEEDSYRENYKNWILSIAKEEYKLLEKLCE